VLTSALSWVEVAVPFGSTLLGGATVFAVSRHLKRQELYVEAAQKINDYLDEAVKVLKKMDGAEFDEEQTELARIAVSSAVFHSRRLESKEATDRLRVAEFVLWHMIDSEDRGARYWANLALENALSAVVQFMLLPRLWPPFRTRNFPPSELPSTVNEYADLVEPKGDTDKLNWGALRDWHLQRRRELRKQQRGS
jgi:hypothetical protein